MYNASLLQTKLSSMKKERKYPFLNKAYQSKLITLYMYLYFHQSLGGAPIVSLMLIQIYLIKLFRKNKNKEKHTT